MKTPSSLPRLGAFSLMVSGLFAWLPTQAQSVIVNDTFTGVTGQAQNGAALGDAGWYFFNPSDAGSAWTTSSAPEGASLLSGTTLATGSGVRANTYAYRPFESVTLSNVGDSITLQLDFRSAGSSPGQLIVGLLDFVTPPSSTILGGGEAANPLIGATGVEFRQFFDGSTSRGYRDGTYALSGGSIVGMTNTLVGDTTAVGANIDHRLIFTLTLENDGLHVLASITADGSTTTLDEHMVSVAGSFTVDTLRLSTRGGINHDVHFDNIMVSTNVAIPEPAAGALLLGCAAAVMGLGWRRDRRSASSRP